ncbi:SF1B family DNA helicase RecD2 [Herpetosiphon geysericola]|uniref:ATP-dependent RecD2 DNA helicase n=1 Tax=Herpetosiphon geysericola TaxID=70996 RepID=A0A0P6XZF6_9CHLR|nr:ATP-dependent RecD-like DNA helicase [Herpetosiphon geysericola]KPL81899.1 hypothetical protein SE18_20050 [Herpetosiphon geysericola]
MAQLTGNLERITYRSEETGYTVARLKAQGQRSVITIVGRLPDVQVGESLQLEGEWTEHRTHGRQFEVSSYQTTRPTGNESIVRYLASGLLPGIGPVNAQRIADTFGEATLDVLDQTPERLREVKGLGTKKIAAIIAAWQEQRSIKALLELGQAVGLTTGLALRIFRHYGEQASHIVQHDPYRLALEIEGIGFPSADQIAQALGVARDAPSRVIAGLRYTLGTVANSEGHCALPQAALIEQTQAILELPRNLIAEQLALATEAVLLVLDGDLVYLPAYYHAETELAANLRRLQQLPSAIQLRFKQQSDAIILRQLHNANFDLSERQAEAVLAVLRSKVVLLTGGPGTGKTTTVQAILALLQQVGLRTILAAPTGRAARRLSETTNHPAATLHRTLEYAGGAGNDRWGRNEHNPLAADLVVIDETSMLDILLAHHVVKALAPTTHLLLVGDPDQLPAVGAGAVLRDLLASNSITTVHLDTIFRQAADSQIITNAHAINQGQLPSVNRGDFYWFPRSNPAECSAMIVELLTTRIPRQFPQFDPLRDIQVLAATHRGAAGVLELNSQLQAALNPAKPNLQEATLAGTLFREGDRVIQTRNNYDLDVSNGDLGLIQSIDHDERTVSVYFDDTRTVVYQWNEFDEVALAYAISVHKAQGSEYPVVIVPMLRYYNVLLNRPLLYTAITRARQLVILTGDWQAVEFAIAQRRSVQRITGLMQRVTEHRA